LKNSRTPWNGDAPSSAEKKNSMFIMCSATLIKPVSSFKNQPNLEDEIPLRGVDL